MKSRFLVHKCVALNSFVFKVVVVIALFKNKGYFYRFLEARFKIKDGLFKLRSALGITNVSRELLNERPVEAPIMNSASFLETGLNNNSIISQ